MLRIFCLLLLGAVSLASDQDAAPPAPNNKEVAGPLPLAVRLSDTLESFVARYPDARPAHPDRGAEADGPPAPESLVLRYEADPVYGLPMLADFGFREGRLYEFVAVWKSVPEKMAAPRRAFWRDCLARHGAAYERGLLPIFVKTGEERLVAAACWRTPESIVLAYCVEEKDAPSSGKSMLVYAQFQPDDLTIARNLAAADLSLEEHAALWRDLDALIQEAASSAD